jgi:hypothetical protein
MVARHVTTHDDAVGGIPYALPLRLQHECWSCFISGLRLCQWVGFRAFDANGDANPYVGLLLARNWYLWLFQVATVC